MADEKSTFRPEEDKQDISEEISSMLSDVGRYSYAGLTAVSLLKLFEDEWHSEFKKKTLQLVLEHLSQSESSCKTMFLVMEGEGMSDASPFVDALLKEPRLKESRMPLLEDMVGMAVSNGCYDARWRVLIKYMCLQLRISWDDIEQVETTLAETLEESAYEMSEEEKQEKAKKRRKEKIKRYVLIGIATVGGGTLIGLTGGLAAPLVAAGAGAIIGGAGAAALGSTAGVAIIGSLFGVAGAGLAGFKMKKRVGALEEFSFEPLTVVGGRLRMGEITKQLHISIAVTGWLTDSMNDFRIPWKCLAESKEQYSVRWESKYLLQLGNAFEYILSLGMGVATSEALKYTVLAGIMAAVAWPSALMSAAGVIDNPWSVVTQRANNAGKQLAEVLLAREQGNRPVTLIGYSMGARVVFSCLEELSKRKGGDGLVEDVILLGAPVSGDPKNWQPLARVVAGRIVNGYCRSDWLLKFLYRTASVQIKIAGLGPVIWENRRMHNFDLSGVLDGHRDYEKNLDTLMKAVGVRTKDELKVSAKVKKSLPKTAVSSGSHNSQQSQGETMVTSQIQLNLSTENDSLVSSQTGSIQLSESRPDILLCDSISPHTATTTIIDGVGEETYCESLTQESGFVSLQSDAETDFTVSPQLKDTNENEINADDINLCVKINSDDMDADKESHNIRTGRQITSTKIHEVPMNTGYTCLESDTSVDIETQISKLSIAEKVTQK
ncbi:hypothetical protein CHS0354_022776 [Potamilus streckersoni]|uniref:Transmembrane and coiled-coil domain-containing protein 4 n=1 Tax=Potamilus streckersoni TaxID=2493646 RepID=A0AAE0S209_9BIVA|nr:hypothetical protein CHS0354_022776 [Potamilus streckersoni]